ncbi:MAG: CatB-related O-acetyltransferase [Bacteroidales bacterium]|nr:CatB-related O-acetyltransferase [Bacteroidales bacterium]
MYLIKCIRHVVYKLELRINTYLKNWIKEDTYISKDTYINEKASLVAPFMLESAFVDSYTYIARNSIITRTTIGKFCSIGPNFFSGWGIHPINGISTSPMFYSTKKQNGYSLSNIDKVEESKPIIIGNDVFIGANVIILDGITIGDGAVIGAGTVVTKNVPPYAVVVGSPMKIIKYRFSNDTINKLLDIKWWNFSSEKLKDVEANFFNIESFIKSNSKN